MGRVTDETGKPIAAATVYVSGETSRAVLTNAQGYYVFLAVPEGQYSVKVFKRGLPRLRTNKIFVPSHITVRKDFSFGDTGEPQRQMLAKAGAPKPLPKPAEPAAPKVETSHEKPVAQPTPTAKPAPAPATEEVALASASTGEMVETTEIKGISTATITDEGLRKAAEQAEEVEKAAIATVEKDVELEGGLAAIVKKIVYPETAKNLKIEGLVVARVYVDESGNLTRIDLLKTAHELLDEEAIRVLSEEAIFKPAKAGNKDVAGALTVPIKFKIAKVTW
ncbi:TonB family protein [Chloroherpeton thalassium ATCC 35110]|uniref:TonB family protein n=1 Tax=Chloroherpeton thalassium (strain ATCC 35110 / GB-78) TaxID=517418 RepID=B3QT94_CHLT3|nr:TonB family protein [Chloroherpeton thalassium]ACF14193.1 TonB family protein [Chloroherpeton thalassium ATCC 35110]